MLIDLMKEIAAFFKTHWKNSGEWMPSVLDDLEPKKRKPGRPKGSKNKK